MSIAPLDGAVVAITGGGRGIGFAAATRFARAGAIVCAGDIDGERAADAAAAIDGSVQPFQLDVSSPDSMRRFVRDVERAAGPIDVLVNNAGVMPAGRFLDEDLATTETVFGVNAAGPLFGMRTVLPGMIERGRGHIVNVASILGKLELPGLASYTASEHALLGLSGAVRHELAGTGVTLTVVLPGIVDTELSAGFRLPRLVSAPLRASADDVATAIVASCRDAPRELAVPRWLELLPAIRPFLLPGVEDALRRLIGHDRVLRNVDGERRAAYEARITEQARED